MLVPVVYTDGSCPSNGKTDGKTKAGWAIYWGLDHPENSCGPVFVKQTNNRAELVAVLKAFESAKRQGLSSFILRTDSDLIVKSLNDYIFNWKKNGWKTRGRTPVLNDELLKTIDSMRDTFSNVTIEHVKGHNTDPGNLMADRMANEGAKRCDYFIIFSSRYRPTNFKQLLKSYRRAYNRCCNRDGEMSLRRLKDAVYYSRYSIRRWGVDKPFLKSLPKKLYSFEEFIVITEIALRWEIDVDLNKENIKVIEKTSQGYVVTDDFVEFVEKYIPDEEINMGRMQNYLNIHLSAIGVYQL